MIEIIPIKKELSDILKADIKEKNVFYTTSLTLISKLLSMEEFPIANKRIAIETILSFLNYIDNRIKLADSTILPISSEDLINYLTRKKYLEYLDLLKKLNVISIVPYSDGKYFEIGKRNNLYRVFNNYITDDICLVLFNKKNKLKLDKDIDYNNKLEYTILNVEIDIKNAIIDEIQNHINNNTTTNSLRLRLSTIARLNTERYIKRGNKVNRTYHSLSQLSKISRKYLHINGETFNNIDIKNCQPLLLCYLLKKYNMEIDENYIIDCQNGLLYEQFGDNRNEIKTELYRCIYFDFKPKEYISKFFQELYPKTFNSLEILSSQNETIASLLQNIEADIFNNLIPKNSKFYFTLFDAIYFTDLSDLMSIINDIKDKFKICGLNPMVSINDNVDNSIE